MRAATWRKRSCSLSMPFMKMTRTRVKASTSSLLYGLPASSRQVKPWSSSDTPLSFFRSSAMVRLLAGICWPEDAERRTAREDTGVRVPGRRLVPLVARTAARVVGRVRPGGTCHETCTLLCAVAGTRLWSGAAGRTHPGRRGSTGLGRADHARDGDPHAVRFDARSDRQSAGPDALHRRDHGARGYVHGP